MTPHEIVRSVFARVGRRPSAFTVAVAAIEVERERGLGWTDEEISTALETTLRDRHEFTVRLK